MMNNQSKKKYVLVCFLLATMAMFSQTKTKKVNSKIEKVIVFSQGAQVSRSANATFDSGKTELVFQGISPKIDKQSLQVKGKGRFTILSVIHQNNFLNTQQHRAEISKLETEKKVWELKKTTETNILSILKNEEGILSKNQVVGGTNSGLKTTDLREAVEFHRQRLIDLVKQKTEIEQKIMGIDTTLVKLDKQLKALNQSDENATSDIVVTVSATNAVANASFDIDYYVLDAGWYSNYDLRVEDVNSPINLLLKANIFQSSGEDWKDVNMSISSGNPTESGVAPTITPWYLDLNQRKVQSTVQTFGQLVGNTISGTVSDYIGPLAGANVVVRGTSIGTTTDFNGNYTLKVPSVNSELVFTYVGMEEKIVPANSNVINVVLDQSVALLEAVVVTGYSSRKSRKN